MELLHQPGETIVNRYRIIDILGQGGVGITYKAYDIEQDKHIALKMLSLHRMSDWKKMELFEREAKILAQLNHSAIPKYIDYFQVDTKLDKAFYIVQQLAPGKSLAELIENEWCPNENEVHNIAIQILDILIYLQSLTPAVIHRDIKPQNVIREENGNIFLVDFGAVVNNHNTIAGGSTVVGTFGYMAPEQFRGQAVPATDLYGLGATLLFLLTGKSPADLPQRQLKIDFRKEVNISHDFANWLDKMLEPVSSNRFLSAKEAVSVLNGGAIMQNYSPVKPRRPKNTSVSLKHSDGNLNITIPFGYLNNNYSLAVGLLFLALFGIILVSLWTIIFEYVFFNNFFIAVLLMFSFFLFCKFGWSSTYRILNTFILSLFTYTHLYIDQHYFTINRNLFGIRLKQELGIIGEIESVDLIGKKPTQVCRINHRFGIHCFGAYLSKAEKQWLVWEIRDFLESVEQDVRYK
jgi:eukaryotic-like serine/threonine-protein kinase